MADQYSGEGSSSNGVSGESSESTVELNIKTLDSQIYSFHVEKDMLVSSFKEKIANEIGVPVGQQRLIFRGKVLKDDHLLSEYHVENGHTLHLVERQPVQSQPPSSAAGSGEANGNNSNRGNDASAGGPRNRGGQISHSVVLGTFNVGDQGEGVMPDISRVIGSVLNSFGIGSQTSTGVGGAQPSVQAPQGNVTEGNQAQGGQAIPLQIPLSGLALPVPSLQAPIPNSLYTLSEFVSRMEQAFAHSGQQPNPSPTNPGDVPIVQLPSDARGLPTIEALSIVLRHVQRLLNDHVVAELSHIAGRLENEGVETDPTARGQIQAESMQVGFAMQHLGALFLELGRTLLTLRMGQSPAESSVNTGPAVFISALGPNPIMVQPFPLQTSSLFGSPAVPPLNSGAFGPVGIGSAPRHINIHIHAGTSLSPIVSAVGTRPSNGEGLQGERVNGSGSDNSTHQVVVPVRNIIAAAVPSRSTGVAVPSAVQPTVSSSQAPPGMPESSIAQNRSVGSVSAQDVDVGGDDHPSIVAVSGAGEANVSLSACEGEGQKEHAECHQVNNDAGGALSSNTVPSTFSIVESMGCSNGDTNATSSSEEIAKPKSDNSSEGTTGVPLGLGLGGLQPKRRSRPSKLQSKSGVGASSNPPLNQNQNASGSGQQILQSLASSISSASGTNGNDQPSGQLPPLLGQIMGCLPSGGQGPGSQFDASSMLTQISQSLSGQTGVGSPDGLRNMMDQFTRNPLIRDTVNQISEQIDTENLGNMISGLGRGQGGGIDLSRMVQQMMPIVSQALNNVPAFAGQLPSVEADAEPQENEQKLSGIDSLDDQVGLQQVTRRIEHCRPPADIFHAMVETAQSCGNELTGDLASELCSDETLANEYMEMLRHDVCERLQSDSRFAEKS